MDFVLGIALNEATTRTLGVLGFLVFLPVLFYLGARVSKRVIERRHADEFTGEVQAGAGTDADAWTQNLINGD